jgi:hypothetical protein
MVYVRSISTKPPNPNILVPAIFFDAQVCRHQLFKQDGDLQCEAMVYLNSIDASPEQ